MEFFLYKYTIGRIIAPRKPPILSFYSGINEQIIDHLQKILFTIFWTHNFGNLSSLVLKTQVFEIYKINMF